MSVFFTCRERPERGVEKGKWSERREKGARRENGKERDPSSTRKVASAVFVPM